MVQQRSAPFPQNSLWGGCFNDSASLRNSDFQFPSRQIAYPICRHLQCSAYPNDVVRQLRRHSKRERERERERGLSPQLRRVLYVVVLLSESDPPGTECSIAQRLTSIPHTAFIVPYYYEPNIVDINCRVW